MRCPTRRFARAFVIAAFALLLTLRITATAPAPADGTLLERAYALDSASGDQRDAKGAAQLYAAAADDGDAFAHLRLGHLCEIGDGVPQDYAAARAHYQAAVDLGLAAARVPLAICHLEGWGGAVDREAFVREIRLAAEAGEASAQRILGGLYAAGLMVPSNMVESAAWLEKAARSDAGAQHDLGIISEQAHRFVTARNLEIARTWYQLSAESEYLVGMRAMARTFLERSHGAPDWAAFRQWLALATDSGDAEAPYILALVEVVRRDATPEQEARALAWLKTAGERGNLRALEVLDFVSTGQSVQQAMHYVMTESQDERYVQRVQRRAGDGPTRPPVPFKTVAPVYPLTFRVAGIPGKVTLRFVVDTTGRARDIQTIATTHPLLAERSSAALQQWRFHPARKDGRPVNCLTQVDFPFELDEESAYGTDGLLSTARSKAQDLGPEFEALAVELQLARSMAPLPPVPHGEAQPNERRFAFVLLALDAAGKPQRGLVLQAQPAELGTEVLAIGLKARFHPRRINGEAVPSNVLLPYFSEAMVLPTPDAAAR